MPTPLLAPILLVDPVFEQGVIAPLSAGILNASERPLATWSESAVPGMQPLE